jgi:hypothetical protein
MKRHSTLLGLVLALPLTFVIGVAGAQELERVVIGHSSLRNDIAFLWVPQQLGLFKKTALTRPLYLFLGEYA